MRTDAGTRITIGSKLLDGLYFGRASPLAIIAQNGFTTGKDTQKPWKNFCDQHPPPDD